MASLKVGVLAAGGTEYLVDAIALHDHLHALRDILADPKITKVPSGMLFLGMHQSTQGRRTSLPGSDEVVPVVVTEGEGCLHP